jgi:hypothetical protein
MRRRGRLARGRTAAARATARRSPPGGDRPARVPPSGSGALSSGRAAAAAGSLLPRRVVAGLGTAGKSVCFVAGDACEDSASVQSASAAASPPRSSVRPASSRFTATPRSCQTAELPRTRAELGCARNGLRRKRGGRGGSACGRDPSPLLLRLTSRSPSFRRADRDLLRLLLGRLRDPQLEHAVLVAGLDRVAVDALGKGERANERAVRPLDELRLPRLVRTTRAEIASTFSLTSTFTSSAFTPARRP